MRDSRSEFGSFRWDRYSWVPRVSKDRYRSIGALIGLGSGIGLMRLVGLSDMVAAAVFGAGGCVAGAIAAEKLFAWNQRRGR